MPARYTHKGSFKCKLVFGHGMRKSCVVRVADIHEFAGNGPWRIVTVTTDGPIFKSEQDVTADHCQLS